TTAATTTTSATDPPAPSATAAATVPAEEPSPAGGVWLELRECESGDNYQADTGNGYYGAYQFSPSTWSDLGYPGLPDEEPSWMQDQAAQRLEADEGWAQWPSCSAALGL
ncbi:MAG: transglycosylase family protein, partial [Acidimicrobiales bacterium]